MGASRSIAVRCLAEAVRELQGRMHGMQWRFCQATQDGMKPSEKRSWRSKMCLLHHLNICNIIFQLPYRYWQLFHMKGNSKVSLYSFEFNFPEFVGQSAFCRKTTGVTTHVLTKWDVFANRTFSTLASWLWKRWQRWGPHGRRRLS